MTAVRGEEREKREEREEWDSIWSGVTIMPIRGEGLEHLIPRAER